LTSSFDLDPDHFAPGAIGPPGGRVFYLQVAEGDRLATFRLEKQQVAAMAEYLAGILEDLPAFTWPDVDGFELREPVVTEWVVGTIAVAYEEAADRILVVVEELVDPEDEARADEAPATARFRVTRPQVALFIGRAATLILGGRPPCPLCGRPVDPEGHVCPRSNGHHG
jgi:uncharacterized repeat protein (TIGR03847 family)